MYHTFKLLSLSALLSLSLPPSTLAVPASLRSVRSALSIRQSCADTCGSTCYYASDVSAAQNQGYSLYENGETEGSDEYPHQYNDYEGFDFPVDGPYYEFPILSSYQVYSGGSPGPDRVVFNDNNELAGLITHTGASGDDFLQCQQD